MVENDPINIPLLEDKEDPTPERRTSGNGRTSRNEKTDRDGDVDMTGVDNEDPVDAKSIKVYPFSINKLNKKNTRI